MTPMNPQSARTLVWMAAILAVLGLVIPAPAGSLALFVLAALCALVPTVFARRATRLAAAVALVVSIGLIATIYPKYQDEMSGFADRAKSGKR